MKLLVGLGNPGPQYAMTRHNAGFLILDTFVGDHGGSRQQKSSFHGEMSEITVGGEKILCLKPLTFMNLSGKSVLAVMQFYKIEPADVLIIHDEIDFAFAKLQLKQGGSHAGHNGIKDIYTKTGLQDFWRLRIGIGRPQTPPSFGHLPLSGEKTLLGGKESVSDYVLCNFSQEELPLFQADIMTQSIVLIEKWVVGKHQ